MRTLSFNSQSLPLSRPLLMGIVNVTPDSFSDGGAWFGFDKALDHALRLADDGADIIDIGGESSRPGAKAVPEEEELRRVLPLTEELVKRGIKVSVDTVKPRVMREVARAGAMMLNDINALLAPGAMEAAAQSKASVCLMHMKGEPRTMQEAPHYDDVVREVTDFLLARAKACEDAGIERERIVLDPGFGFGKSVAHNIELMRALPKLCELPYPVLVGWSRKSTLGAIVGRPVEERLAASIAAHLAAAQAGALILRVHDVREMADALKVWETFI